MSGMSGIVPRCRCVTRERSARVPLEMVVHPRGEGVYPGLQPSGQSVDAGAKIGGLDLDVATQGVDAATQGIDAATQIEEVARQRPREQCIAVQATASMRPTVARGAYRQSNGLRHRGRSRFERFGRQRSLPVIVWSLPSPVEVRATAACTMQDSLTAPAESLPASANWISRNVMTRCAIGDTASQRSWERSRFLHSFRHVLVSRNRTRARSGDPVPRRFRR